MRPTSPKPPTWPTGTAITFTAEGGTYVGTFLRRFTPVRGAGYHYEIRSEGRTHVLFANGPVARTIAPMRG